MMIPYQFKESDITDFSKFVGIQCTKRGEEYIFKRCPYCKGGGTRGKVDHDTFAINAITGAFNCKRNGCGVTGNMLTLSKDFDFSLGTTADEYFRPRKRFRVLPTPEKPYVPKEPAVRYLESRGISEETAKRYEITVQDKHEDVLVFPFYDEKGRLQFVKYRKIGYKKGDSGSKEWCQEKCKPILFGMKQCNTENKTLVVCEGQLDSLSVAECGIENAVSVPTGAKGFTWIPYCWDWLQGFETIIVFGDHENGHITLLDEFSRRFGKRIKHVREEDYKDCKDANEILCKYGKEQVRQCVENAVSVPVKQVIDLSQVEDVDIFKIEKLKTGIRQIDRLLYGGLPFGGVHLLTGKSGEGKLLADDTPIFTKDGWKKHGDLVVGDYVLGVDGSFVRVKRVFPKGLANMRVVLNNRDVIYCHENHEWITNCHSGTKYVQRIMTAREIYERLHGEQYRRSVRLIERKPLIGEKSELFVKPYTFGAWLGDGRNQYPDICEPPKDYCIIDSIIKDDGYEVAWHTTHKTTGVLYYGFKNLRKGLRKYGLCHSHKKTQKYIPQCYLTASIEERLELLAGLLDTDGYYDKTANKYTYATTEETLKDSFIDLIRTFGWNCYCMTIEPKTSSSGIVGRKKVYALGFNPVGLDIPCRVERKRQTRVRPKCKRVPSILEIEYCEPKIGNCIEVEGGVYCAGKSMTPTHNSTFASQILIQARYQGYKCFAYSGELPNYLFKAWMNSQVAGRRCAIEYQNTDLKFCGYTISQNNRKLIDDWYRDQIYLYDNSALDGEEMTGLLKIIEQVIQQYGVKVILLDNLMTAMIMDAAKGSDQYERQTDFVNKLRIIALRYNVMVILIAHMRKNNFSQNGNDEIAGSSNISNIAMITMSYERKQEFSENQRVVKVMKNRLFGRVNMDGFLVDYDEKSRRIYGQGDNIDFDYGFDPQSSEYDEFMPLPDDIQF